MFVLVRINAILFLSLLFALICIGKTDNSNSFQVVAYNVENLFDMDGISFYNDYKEEMYGFRELENKLNSISQTLKKIGGKSGPDVILFQEIEVDRTPDKELSATEELLRELKLNGLGPYYFKLGYNPNAPPENWPAVHCLTLSKFPFTDSRIHPLEKARPILETTISVNGHPFTLFNNHWKSGASSEKMEVHRIQNAQVLRSRIDQLVEKKPNLDFLVGGDLNSHYNQSTIYRDEMKRTGINDILLSDGVEPIKRFRGKRLYNLWFELPTTQRGSDAWRGKWGTLMHILLPGSLYDSTGICYVTDSFQVEKIYGVNVISGMDIPFKWSNELNGFGASDHFPVSARFHTNAKQPEKGNNFPEVENIQRSINYKKAKESANIWLNSNLKPQNYGRSYRLSGAIVRKKPLTLKIQDRFLGLYSFDQKVRNSLYSLSEGDNFSGYGYLSRYRGQWQFIIPHSDWID
jgi:endonuclease/exonuclease/phosphatase family metal-dependent hydrolase